VKEVPVTDASLEFEIQPNSGVPIYRQIMDQVRAFVASRRLQSGAMLPSIRQLATDLKVNMMTVSKAYAKLEADGVLERVRGTGMRVRQQLALPSLAERQQELTPFIEPLVTRALQLGLTEQQLIASVRSHLKERQSWSKSTSTSRA
jgi:GntR family transcriptional regulator